MKTTLGFSCPKSDCIMDYAAFLYLWRLEWMNRFFSGSCSHPKITVMRQKKGAWYYRETEDKKLTPWDCLWVISKPQVHSGSHRQFRRALIWSLERLYMTLCFCRGLEQICNLKNYPSISFYIQESKPPGCHVGFSLGMRYFWFFFSSFEHCSYSNHFLGSTQVPILFYLNSCLVN